MNEERITPVLETDDLTVTNVSVEYIKELDLLVFQQKVKGEAGGLIPEANGALDGAPVLGYVFPTTLQPEDVWFNGTGENAIIALAVVSHPDFDDTPLWDENNDGNFDNDGAVYHTHWVALQEDERVEGGFSVEEMEEDKISEALPPTNPGMPMYMDWPGFSVIMEDHTLKALVPAQRVHYNTEFNFDAVSAYMQVNQSDEGRPLLGVYKVYKVLSGDLSLPYEIERK